MPHRASLPFVVGLIALAAASLAGVCGNPDAVETPTTDRTGTASVTSTPIAAIADTSTAVSVTVTPVPDAPIPTATLEDEPTSAPERMRSLSTPSSTSDAMVFHGWMYLDAQPARGPVKAFVGDQLCGEGSAAPLADEAGLFSVTIESDAHQAGCGVPGSTVTVTINDIHVDQAVEWQPGYAEAVRLSAGHAVAFYRGTMSVGAGLPPSARVVPLIGDVTCGEPAFGSIWPQDHARWLFQLAVDPDEVTVGCGKEGLDVTLVLRIDGQPDIVIDVVPWQPLPPVVLPNIDIRDQLRATHVALEPTP